MNKSNKKIKEFFVKQIKEGERVPLFYLPVWRYIDMYGFEAWILPIAPFVLFYKIITSVFYYVWRDLVEFSYLVRIKAKSKLNELSNKK